MFFAAYLISGAGLEPFSVYWRTALQREIPSDKLARCHQLDWMASLALMPVGMALTGPAVAGVGEHTVLLLAAAVNVVSTFAVLFVPGVVELRTPRAGRAAEAACPRGLSRSRSGTSVRWKFR